MGLLGRVWVGRHTDAAIACPRSVRQTTAVTDPGMRPEPLLWALHIVLHSRAHAAQHAASSRARSATGRRTACRVVLRRGRRGRVLTTPPKCGRLRSNFGMTWCALVCVQAVRSTSTQCIPLSAIGLVCCVRQCPPKPPQQIGRRRLDFGVRRGRPDTFGWMACCARCGRDRADLCVRRRQAGLPNCRKLDSGRQIAKHRFSVV